MARYGSRLKSKTENDVFFCYDAVNAFLLKENDTVFGNGTALNRGNGRSETVRSG